MCEKLLKPMDSNIQTLSVIPVGRLEPSEEFAQGEESFHQTETPPTQPETIND